jgi:WD40 repeat protein
VSRQVSAYNPASAYEVQHGNPAQPVSLGPRSPNRIPFGLNSVAFSPDRRTLAAGSFEGLVRLQTLDVNTAVQRICATTTDTLTPAQRKQYISQLAFNPPRSLRRGMPPWRGG